MDIVLGSTWEVGPDFRKNATRIFETNVSTPFNLHFTKVNLERGGWEEMELFNPEMGYERVVYFNPNVAILKNIDWLLEYDGTLLGTENIEVTNPEISKKSMPYYRSEFTTPVMAFDGEALAGIWHIYKQNINFFHQFDNCGEAIDMLIRGKDRDLIQQLYPGKLISHYEDATDETSLVIGG